MNNLYIKPEQLNRIKKTYPVGTRVELVRMDDPYNPPPPGTQGTVMGVDDAGSLEMRWDNGSGLSVVWGVDEVRIISKPNDN